MVVSRRKFPDGSFSEIVIVPELCARRGRCNLHGNYGCANVENPDRLNYFGLPFLLLSVAAGLTT